jgi:hypothetical protein
LIRGRRHPEAPRGTCGCILVGGLIPDGSQKSDLSEARPHTRKKHHYVEIADEKAFGEGNIWTKAAPRRAQINFSIGGAPAFERKHAQSVERAS